MLIRAFRNVAIHNLLHYRSSHDIYEIARDSYWGKVLLYLDYKLFCLYLKRSAYLQLKYILVRIFHKRIFYFTFHYCSDGSTFLLWSCRGTVNILFLAVGSF